MGLAKRRFRKAIGIAMLLGIALVVAKPQAVAALTPNWPQSRDGAGQTGYNPYETQLNIADVPHLVTRAIVPLDDTYAAASPVMAGGMVFITSYTLGSSPAEVEAFREACGAAPGGPGCLPLWRATVGSDAESSAAVADGEVFVDSNNGAPVPSQELWVFPERCGIGGSSCAPVWTATIPGSVGSEAAPTVAGSTVYVPGGQAGNAYLYAFPVRCSTPCEPTWRGQMDIGDALESVAVGDGRVFVPDYDGNLDAFRVGCAADGGVCEPVWQGYTGQLGPSGPAVAGNLVVLGSQNDDVYAFRAHGCGRGRVACPPVWRAKTGRNVRSDPAIAQGVVYITSDDGYLYAFPERCRSVCHPLWRDFLSRGEDSFHSSPAVANGVVYVSWTNSINRQGVDAFAMRCANGRAGCRPIWDGNGGSFFLLSGPAVVGGELWAAGGPFSGPADLYAFGLPSAQ